MPRLPRIHIEGSLYYVTCQGHHFTELFKDGKDYNRYLNSLINYKRQYHFQLFSYCLLPGKVHLLIGTNSEHSISEVMFNLNSSYTKYYNIRYGKKGPVLAGRFKSKWVEKRTCLLPLTRYIHLLPKQKDQKDYIYSSYPAFLGKPYSGIPQVPIAEEIKEITSYLPQGVDYKTYVEKAVLEEVKNLENKLKNSILLGSKAFRDKVYAALEAYKQNKESKTVIQQKKPATPFKDFKARVVFPRYKITMPLLARVSLVILLAFFAGYFYSYMFLGEQQFTTDTVVEVVQAPAETEKSQIETQLKLAEQQLAKREVETAMSQTHPLEDLVWEIQFTPKAVSSEVAGATQKDTLSFKEGKFVSNALMKEGFAPSKYSTRYKEEGVVVWETMQTKKDGTTVNWYGEYNGKVMKGVLSEIPANGKSREFSFVGTRYNREG